MTKGDRIRQVRELRGLSQKELARRIHLDNPSVFSHVEGGRYEPSKELIQAIAFHTVFPPSFFLGGPPLNFALGSLAFRARSRITAREKAQAFQYAKLAFELYQKLSKDVHQIPVRLPSFRSEPEEAAQATRAAVGVSPYDPLPHVTNILERNGVLVLGVPLALETCDAFSLWAGKEQHRPVIALLSGMPGDRIRYSLLHELYHLVCPPSGSIPEIERKADRYAAELLLPEKAMLEELRPPITLATLATLKPRWGASIKALIRRAFELRVITKRQYRYLLMQRAKKWGEKEPALGIAIEKPRALRKVVEVLYGLPIEYKKVAFDCHFPVWLVKDVLEAHRAIKSTALQVNAHQTQPKTKQAAKVVPFRRRAY